MIGDQSEDVVRVICWKVEQTPDIELKFHYKLTELFLLNLNALSWNTNSVCMYAQHEYTNRLLALANDWTKTREKAGAYENDRMNLPRVQNWPLSASNHRFWAYFSNKMNSSRTNGKKSIFVNVPLAWIHLECNFYCPNGLQHGN